MNNGNTPRPYSALSLLVNAARVSPPLREAVREVEDYIRRLEVIVEGIDGPCQHCGGEGCVACDFRCVS